MPADHLTKKRPLTMPFSDPGLLPRIESHLFEDDARDWEYQTRDISLHSPVFTPSASGSEVGTDYGTSESDSRHDVQMVRFPVFEGSAAEN